MLFGRPQFFVDGVEAIGFNTRKDCALLAYLAATGTAHSREHLAGLLWPDVPEAAARRNLRHSLSYLHKVIGPAWIETANSVGLSARLPWSADVQELRSAAAGLRPHLDPAAAAALAQALHCYRGEFLQGFYVKDAPEFEAWVLAQREQHHLLAVRGLEVVARSFLAQGDWRQGLAATRRLLQLEPWLETAHCLQMELLVGSGQRAAALAQYETCRRQLDEELGVAPMPETTALFREIQAGSYRPPAAPAAPAPVSPPQALPPLPHNLLTPLAPFVGRESELELIARRLAAPDCRLLTIVGPGGMGKTSLALAAGQRQLTAAPADFLDGIFFVPLLDVVAGEDSPAGGAAGDAVCGEAVLRAIAQQIGQRLAGGIASAVQLQAYLRPRRLLLILDNFEHLLGGAGAVVTLLGSAPQVKALVTSRARLNVRGEHVLALGKLSLPPADPALDPTLAGGIDGAWQTSEAAAMFVQRARQLDPAFVLDPPTLAAVSRICHLVGGLPLGIELAVSMLPLYSCRALADTLACSLDVLAADTRDLPPDQRTLAAVFERSWRLLPLDAQKLLAALAVFPGSFTLAAAAQIAGAAPAPLRRLLDQSLLSSTGADRYAMHPTIRTFAEQKLRLGLTGEVAPLQERYARFYLGLLARLEPELVGPQYAAATEQFQAELDNVRAAWRRAVAQRLAPELSRCLDALYLLFEQRRFFLEVIDLYEEALRQFWEDRQDAAAVLLAGRLQAYFGLWNNRMGQLSQAQAAYESAWSILQEAGDPAAAALCLGAWGALLRGSDPQRAAVLLQEALRLLQDVKPGWMHAIGNEMMGEVFFLLGDYSAAAAQLANALALAAQLGWFRGLTSTHKTLGLTYLALGDYRAAAAHLTASIGLARTHHFTMLCVESLLFLGRMHRLQGQGSEAAACFAEGRALAAPLGGGVFLAPVLWEEGGLAEQRGEYAAAAALLRESLAIGLPLWWSHVLPTLGWALLGQGALDEAATQFEQALAAAATQGRRPAGLDAQAGLAYVQVLQIRRYAHNGQLQAAIESCAAQLRAIGDDPAAAAETRKRIKKIAAQLFNARVET